MMCVIAALTVNPPGQPTRHTHKLAMLHHQAKQPLHNNPYSHCHICHLFTQQRTQQEGVALVAWEALVAAASCWVS